MSGDLPNVTPVDRAMQEIIRIRRDLDLVLRELAAARPAEQHQPAPVRMIDPRTQRAVGRATRITPGRRRREK